MFLTLNDLHLRGWYGTEYIIKQDGAEDIHVVNYKLASDEYSALRNKYVKSFGIVDNSLVIVLL